MNSRFSRLEIDVERQQQAPGASVTAGTPIRTADHDLAAAHDAYRSGQFEQGLQLYTRALTQNRALVPAWVGQVQMLVELGEFREARLWSDKSLDLFKNNGDLLAAKAQACHREGDRSSASACSDASLQSPGSSALRWRVRGEIMLRQAPRGAKHCFDRSLAEEGAGWFERLCVARIHLFCGKAAAGLEYAQSAVDLQPRLAYCWYVLGSCQEAMGLVDQGARSYAFALQQNPRDAAAREAMHRTTLAAGKSPLARWLRGMFRR